MHAPLAHATLVLIALAATHEKRPETEALLPSVVFGRVAPSAVVVHAMGKGGQVQGGGVVVDAHLVVTNHHVVKDATSVVVTVGESRWEASILKFDGEHDLALLQVKDMQRPRVALRPSTDLKVGEHVYAIGAPRGLELTISEGLVSALRPAGKAFLVQTSAPISPGSSGGGLYDTQGRLVGITSSTVEGGQNLNFAVPSEWITDLRSGVSSGGAVAVSASWAVSNRPASVACSLVSRAVWGLFTDGPEMLESKSYEGGLVLGSFDGQVPHIKTIGSPGWDGDLVLQDMSSKRHFLAFKRAESSIERRYFFLFDEGAISVVVAEPSTIYGEARLVAVSGDCQPISTSQLMGWSLAQRKHVTAAAYAEEPALGRCEKGDGISCMKAASTRSDGDALVYLRKACDVGVSEGCAAAADLYQGADDLEDAAIFSKRAGKTFPAPPRKVIRPGP